MAPSPQELLVGRLFEALNAPDLNALAGLYAPEAVLTFAEPDRPRNKAAQRKAGPERPPPALSGQAAILKYYEWLLFDRRRGQEILLDKVTPQGNALVAEWRLESQDMGLLETGQETLVLGEAGILEHSTSLSELPAFLLEAEPQEYLDTPQQQAPSAPEPVPPTTEPAAAVAWPPDRCLIGLSVGPDEAQLALLRQHGGAAVFVGRVEAVKLPLTARAEDVAALRRANPELFFLVSVYQPSMETKGLSPQAYVDTVAPQIGALYGAGVRDFQIQHHQGILVLNVWEALFGSLTRLAAWFVETRALLQAQFPEARIGFSAIHPPYDRSWAADTERFMSEIEPALQAADWVGVPCHWSSQEERESPDGGRLYRRYRERYPDKLVLVTAFGSHDANPDKDAVAGDHLDYYHSLRHEPGVAAAFADGAADTDGLHHWIGSSGAPGALGNVVGARRWGEPGDQPENFAGFATNDRPDGKDQLGYDDYADAFVRVIRNPDTKTPLTVGIYGAWGMGKSFLMKRIRTLVQAGQQERDAARSRRPWPRRAWDNLLLLRPVRGGPASGRLAAALTRVPSAEVDFHCVEFNAWVYSGSENLWAGLITHLYNDVEKFLGTRRTVPFRFSQNAQRAARKTLWLLALYGVLGLLLSALLNSQQIREAWAALTGAAATLGDAVTLGTTLGALLAALAALPPLLTALRDLANALTLARSEQLAALASRRDFRDKIGFMADIKEEIRMVRRLLDRGRQGRRTRLVIFIDDLDRCEPRKAVEVLEAIMLLLADEDGMPFIVVLGIDARIVVKSVEERYGKVLTEAGISGYEYLDKIVQIPFRIPPPNSDALAQYVTSLLWRSEEDRLKDEADRQARAEQRREAERVNTALRQQAAAQSGQAPPADGAAEPSAPPAPADPRDPRAPAPEIDFAALGRIPQRALPPPEVAFLPDEREAFERYARGDHLSPNPRRVKRILNVYRVVRLLQPNTTAAQRQQVIKWVVLTEQWPFRTAWLLQAAEDDAQRAPAARRFKDADGLRALYAAVLPDVQAKDAQPFAGLDADPDLFDSFIEAAPAITVADLHRLRPYTFNLNPALQSEVLKAVARKGSG